MARRSASGSRAPAERARVVVPLSAGVLLGVALFGLFPEMVTEQGWAISLALVRRRLRTAAAGQPLRLSGVPELFARSRPSRLRV